MLEPALYVITSIIPKKHVAQRERGMGVFTLPQRSTMVGIVGVKIVTRLGLKAIKTRMRIDRHQIRVAGTDMAVFTRVLKIAEHRTTKKAAGTFEWGEYDDPNL